MPSIRRRWFVGLSILAVGLIFAVVRSLAGGRTRLSAGFEQVVRLKPFAGAIRILFIAVLAVLWPRLVDLAVRAGRVDAAERSRLLALRWRVVAWLLIIELMIGQDLFGRFFLATWASRMTLDSYLELSRPCSAGPSMGCCGMSWSEPVSSTSRFWAYSSTTGGNRHRAVSSERSPAFAAADGD